jgi:hypothetical protein
MEYAIIFPEVSIDEFGHDKEINGHLAAVLNDLLEEKRIGGDPPFLDVRRRMIEQDPNVGVKEEDGILERYLI